MHKNDNDNSIDCTKPPPLPKKGVTQQIEDKNNHDNTECAQEQEEKAEVGEGSGAQKTERDKEAQQMCTGLNVKKDTTQQHQTEEQCNTTSCVLEREIPGAQELKPNPEERTLLCTGSHKPSVATQSSCPTQQKPPDKTNWLDKTLQQSEK